ncbi:MAG: hypothetical protein A2W36_01300 [Chloroflexi bacterium RBG_16_58_14]|nr:MAG: hypothetical protein A2W36_01300 [Chloroflexi bacterium RBG_16_58_14]
MKKLEVSYNDVTGLEGAAERANHDPALRQALLDLGFQTIGLLECRAPGAINFEGMKRFVNADDLAMMADATENGEVDEVLTSHDRTIFATVDTFFGGPVVVMRTIFENGVVVETVTRPERGALRAEKNSGLPLVGGLAGKMAFGSLPLWARQDRPRWGYHVELVDTNQPSELWQRHRQRIAELARTLQTSIRPQDNIPLYIALSRRSFEITSYAGQWQTRIANGLIGAFFVFLFAVLLLGKGVMVSLRDQMGFVGEMSIYLLGAIVMAVLMIPLSVALTRLLVPRLPGPPLKPAAELL